MLCPPLSISDETMSDNPKMITAQSVGGTVYVRDERGNTVDVLTFPQTVQVQSYGNGLSVICGTMCYTYTLENGRLEQTGIHGV